MSNRKIAKLAGISTNTAKRVLSIAERNNWDWAAVQGMDDRQLKTFLHSPRQQESGKVIPDWVAIHKLMQGKRQTLIQLWDEYREQHRADAYQTIQNDLGQVQVDFFNCLSPGCWIHPLAAQV